MCPAAYIALLSSRRGERLESWQLLLLSVMNSCSGSKPKELPLLPSALCLPNTGRTPLRPFSRLLPHFINHTIMRYCLYVRLFGSVTFNTGSFVQRPNLVLSSKPDLSFSKCLSLSAEVGREGDSGRATMWEWGSLCTVQ